MLMSGKAPPAAALDEMKAYLRVDTSEEEPLLAALLRSATETVEAMMGVLLVERDVEERAAVRQGEVVLGTEPVRSLGSVHVVAADGGEQLLEPGLAALELSRGGAGKVRLGLADGEAVVIRYRAGMATHWSWLPEVLRLAVLRAAAHFYANRDSRDESGLPLAVKKMVAPWRRRRMR